jgi:hypothetical protein
MSWDEHAHVWAPEGCYCGAKQCRKGKLLLTLHRAVDGEEYTVRNPFQCKNAATENGYCAECAGEAQVEAYENSCFRDATFGG